MNLPPVIRLAPFYSYRFTNKYFPTSRGIRHLLSLHCIVENCLLCNYSHHSHFSGRVLGPYNIKYTTSLYNWPSSLFFDVKKTVAWYVVLFCSFDPIYEEDLRYKKIGFRSKISEIVQISDDQRIMGIQLTTWRMLMYVYYLTRVIRFWLNSFDGFREDFTENKQSYIYHSFSPNTILLAYSQCTFQ
jgi:hypothetical protein